MEQSVPNSGKGAEELRIEDINAQNKEEINVANGRFVTEDQHGVDAGPEKWTLTAALAVVFLGLTWIGAQLPLYFMVGPMAYIVADVNAGQKASWIPLAYVLVQATPVPFAGYVQDIVGRHWMTLISSFSVAIGAVFIGTAHNFPHAVSGSALAGTGGGIAELGAIAGIIQGLAILGVFFTYFPTKHYRMQSMRKSEILKRIDWVRGVLLTTGFTLVLVALQSGGYTNPWSSAYVLCTLFPGIAALVGLCFWEYRAPEFPLLPHELFNRKAIVMAFIVASIVGAFYFSLTNFGPIYLSSVYATDSVTIGLRNIPFPTLTLFGAIGGNFLISRFPRQIPYIMPGFYRLMTLGGGLFILSDPTNPKAVTAFAALAGLGCGGLVVPIATVCAIASPDHLIATTVALTLAFRVLGSTIGYAIYSNIFTNKLKTKLPALVGQYASQAGLPEISLTGFATGFLATPPDPSIANIPGVTPEVISAAALGTQ